MVKLEKIEYKPISVRELLIEIKDLSELMIDLAYSAALFHSKELAEEVLELEKRVDTLAYLINMNAMIAVRDAEDAEFLVGVSIVASAADKISDAAADIATIVIQNIGIHPIVRQAFEKVEEHLMRVKVSSNSILLGVLLSVLELAARIGVDIIAIRRNKEWIINPQGNERLERNDILIARGAPHGIDELKGLAEGTITKLED
ncbi:MAG: potassium channel protein [Candidatus Bathyarchaeota archaeon]|nr:MAG: potassium channel protein [Candidatus Bathyarchaeota archaeon]